MVKFDWCGLHDLCDNQRCLADDSFLRLLVQPLLKCFLPEVFDLLNL